jgi:hypothetical protein
MQRSRPILLVLCLAAILVPSAAESQYRVGPRPDPATGEKYHIEFSAGLWRPALEAIITSEALGIQGSDVDLVNDLGVAQRQFGELRLVLRPTRKTKFRAHYIPIRYAAEQIINRDLVFNGIRYRIGLPVHSTLNWNAWRFAYEYDFIYRDRWFLGLILEAKYTDIELTLENPLATEYTRARAPIPAIGGIGRVYVVPNISITGEMTGFKVPERIHEDYGGRYVDFDLYGTLNLSDHFGVQGGYRSLTLMYRIELDRGDVALRGLYFMGVARF